MLCGCWSQLRPLKTVFMIPEDELQRITEAALRRERQCVYFWRKPCQTAQSRSSRAGCQIKESYRESSQFFRVKHSLRTSKNDTALLPILEAKNNNHVKNDQNEQILKKSLFETLSAGFEVLCREGTKEDHRWNITVPSGIKEIWNWLKIYLYGYSPCFANLSLDVLIIFYFYLFFNV